jgi:outer membrane protein assembly complex protein YaeT
MARAFFAVVVALLALGPSGALGQEREIEIASLTFEGVEHVDKGDLASVLQTKRGSRLPWGRKRYFDRRAFEADLQRIVAFYEDRGFPDAKVLSVDPRLNADQSRIDLTVRVSEGEPIRVTDVELRGFEVLPERRLRRLGRQLPLRENEPLDARLAAESRERAVNELRNHGYPYAEVRLSHQPDAERRERVVLEATPNTLAHFGEVEINGHASVDDEVILRQLSFEPGDRFSREAMRESQRKLYRMELFQFVNVQSIETREPMSPEVPVRVTVGESKHRKWNLGLGYGSEERVRARARWDHVNFFGGARHAAIEGRWSSLSRGVRAELNEPYFLRRNLSLTFQGQVWHASEPTYDQLTRGGRLVLRRQATQETFWSLSLISEFQKSAISEKALNDFTVRDELIALGLDPVTGETRGTLSAVALDVGHDTTNNPLDARRGYVVRGHAEHAGNWLWGSYNYWSGSIEARHYLPIARRFVIANRVSIGSIDPSGNDAANVPFHKRFFLGGATSNRAWGRFELAPLSSEGFPVGGLSMFDGGSELRFPVAGRLGAVVFIDYGNAWAKAWTVDFRDLRFGIGSGLRFQTPIGPVRFDYGYQLNPVEGLLVDGELQERRWRIHFSVGQAF